jgi:membrane associated rhomboid family serine protease
VPLNDRDYMKSSPPPRRRVWTSGGTGDFLSNPVYIIIIINLIVFFATLARRNDIIGNLGLSPGLFTERPWTIITNMFVHDGFWHIFGNMLTLFFFGTAIYQLVGWGWFLLIYFGGGIVGNLLFIWLGTPLSVAIGASGAIYALAGALVVMMPNMRVAVWGVLPLPLWVVILLFFVLWSIPNFIPGVAWQAHLGGLAAGLIAGYFFRRKRRFIYYR